MNLINISINILNKQRFNLDIAATLLFVVKFIILLTSAKTLINIKSKELSKCKKK